MRYKLHGLVIRTENAAKSCQQTSKWLVRDLRKLPTEWSALDYGCGKVRYTICLSRRVRSVVAVDSKVQLSRTQRVAGRRTTLNEYASRFMKNVTVCEAASNRWKSRRYDFILCSNVLSCIPRVADRINLLRELGGVLKPTGFLWATTQFRNTHFKGWTKSPFARRVRDGWLVEGFRGASFYAILPPEKLVRSCRRAGLTVVHSALKGETAFVVAKHCAGSNGEASLRKSPNNCGRPGDGRRSDNVYGR
jgi:2-polyprenyl-3-methyl-5-hydroxy-6-metoxy-1,4-benzoquinol methylase